MCACAQPRSCMHNIRSSAMGAMFACIHIQMYMFRSCVKLHEQIIYGLVSAVSEFFHMLHIISCPRFMVVTDQHRSTTNSVGLTREHD